MFYPKAGVAPEPQVLLLTCLLQDAAFYQCHKALLQVIFLSPHSLFGASSSLSDHSQGNSPSTCYLETYAVQPCQGKNLKHTEI